MRKFLALITGLVFLFSCGNDESNSGNNVDNGKDTANKNTLIVCDFNLAPQQMGLVKRPVVTEGMMQARKPRPRPRPKPPIDTTTTNPQPPTTAARPKILIDFDGHSVPRGTSWNGGNAFDVANSGQTAAEMQMAYDYAVSKYAAYGVDVTTDEAEFMLGNASKRTRVIVTRTSDFYGSGAGGVAYIGSFTWGDNTPCFVFSELLNFNGKFIKEALVHEVGHTLGLQHQAKTVSEEACSVISQYSYGDAAVAPIMGVAYYSAEAIWTIGWTPYCTRQDDVAILNSVIPKI